MNDIKLSVPAQNAIDAREWFEKYQKLLAERDALLKALQTIRCQFLLINARADLTITELSVLEIIGKVLPQTGEPRVAPPCNRCIDADEGCTWVTGKKCKGLKDESEKAAWRGEVCRRCGRDQRMAWSVTDECWRRIVSIGWREQTLCLECFFELADVKKKSILLSDFRYLAAVSFPVEDGGSGDVDRPLFLDSASQEEKTIFLTVVLDIARLYLDLAARGIRKLCGKTRKEAEQRTSSMRKTFKTMYGYDPGPLTETLRKEAELEKVVKAVRDKFNTEDDD